MRIVVATLVLALVTGCSGEEADPQRTVVASFYPLAWAVEQVASDSVDEVVNLTPLGAEPHDIELTPSDIETIRDAQLVVYVSGGFQPVVEDAVAERDGPTLDVLDGDSDPHIWLDPIRFAEVVHEIGLALGRPAEARVLEETLVEIDRAYRRALRNCARTTFVTTHAAFGHLAERYGLTQLSLAGTTPESEPGPRELERLVAEVEASGAPMVFAEPLVAEGLAATVAREADVDVSFLDPVEGLSDERLDAGDDYASVMLDNLNALTKALGCR